MTTSVARFDWMVFAHRYVGLLLGLWLFAIGSTGSMLAYYREIDVLLNPELFMAVKSLPIVTPLIIGTIP